MNKFGRKLKSVSSKQWIIAMSFIVIVVFAGLFAFGTLSLNLAGTGEDGFTTPTNYTFLVSDYVTGLETDTDYYEINIFGVDVSEMTEDEIDDLVFADYSLEKAGVDAGDTFTPDADFDYYAKLNGSDVDEYWFVPQLGLNTLYSMNSTEDVAMISYSVDEFASTINQTNYDEWNIIIQTLDDSEGTGEATTKEGYKPYYDFEDDVDYSLVLRIEFNTTALLSWCDFESAYTAVESAGGNYIYYEIDAVLFGSMNLEIDLGSALGTDFECIGMSIGYGNSASFTAWDAQN